jgi:hypothetical protein
VLGHISLIASPSFASLDATRPESSTSFGWWRLPVDDGAGYMLYPLLAGSALVLKSHSVPPLSSWTYLRLRSSIFIKRNTPNCPADASQRLNGKTLPQQIGIDQRTLSVARSWCQLKVDYGLPAILDATPSMPQHLG